MKRWIPTRAGSRWRWLQAALLLLALLWLGAFAANLVLRQERVHRALQRRIERAVGRAVEVSRFRVAYLEGARLVAGGVTIADDPRFSFEHLLRAEQMSASLRFSALLRGRLEFDALSITRPSLNVVRNSAGEWNVESWLAAAGAPASGEWTGPRGALLDRITVEGGRINLKHNTEKIPLALVEVDGSFAREAAGPGGERWRLDFEFSLFRAAVNLQQPGLFRLRGFVGGAAGTLHPAELSLTIEEAAVADLLRFALGNDFGVRGELQSEATLRSEAAPGGAEAGSIWKLGLALRLRELHRWDLPARAGDPAVNLTLEAGWTREQRRIEFSRIVLEAPASNIRGSGFADWQQPDTSFRLASSGIALADFLAWHRAFHPGVSEAVAVEGNAGLSAEVRGWPLRVEKAVLATDGAQLRVPGVAGPFRLGRAVLRATGHRFELLPAVLSTAPEGAARRAAPGSELRLEGSAALAEAGEYSLRMAGATSTAEEWNAALVALGLPVAPHSAFEGGARLQLDWQGTLWPFTAAPSGSLDARDFRISSSLLNQPVLLGEARIEWQRGPRAAASTCRLTIASAQALGATWQGTALLAPGQPWTFQLRTDRVSAPDVANWLAPRPADSVYARVAERLPFLRGGARPSLAELLAALRASGSVSVGLIEFPPLSARNLRARIELSGESFRVSEASADFGGGALAASFRAGWLPEPQLRFEGRFDRVQLASFVAPLPNLRERLSGIVSGTLELTAQGKNPADYLASLEGSGRFTLREPQVRWLDWEESAQQQAGQAGRMAFAGGALTFALKGTNVNVEELVLEQPGAEWNISGGITLAQELRLQFERTELPAARPAATAPPEPAARTRFRIEGTFDAPRVRPF